MDIRKLKLTAERLTIILNTFALIIFSQHKPTDEMSAAEWAKLLYTHMALYTDEPKYRDKMYKLLEQEEAHLNANKELSLEELITLNDFPEEMEEN